MKASIKRVLENLFKKCSSSLEIYVLCKIVEKFVGKVMEDNKAAAVEDYQQMIKDGIEPEVFECRLKKYTSPKKYDYSDEVKLLEIKLKGLKKEEEQNNTARLVSEGVESFSVAL